MKILDIEIVDENTRTVSSDESTLSKSMTIMAGSSQLQSHRNKPMRSESRSGNRNVTRHEISHHDESESDTSASPINEFSNTPTYRVPTKSSRGNILIGFFFCFSTVR